MNATRSFIGKEKIWKYVWNVYKEGKTLWKSLGKNKSSVWVVTEHWIEIWSAKNGEIKLIRGIKRTVSSETEAKTYESSPT